MLVPAELVTTPVGQKSQDWVKTLKPELLNDPRLKMLSTKVSESSQLGSFR